MSTDLYFDPDKVADRKPYEQIDHGWASVSPFDIPDYLTLGIDPKDGLIHCIDFHYQGGETAGQFQRLIDPGDPQIRVFQGQRSGKILRMEFSAPIRFEQIPDIGGRINGAAPSIEAPSTRLNHMLVGRLLQDWDKVFTKLDEPPNLGGG